VTLGDRILAQLREGDGLSTRALADAVGSTSAQTARELTRLEKQRRVRWERRDPENARSPRTWWSVEADQQHARAADAELASLLSYARGLDVNAADAFDARQLLYGLARVDHARRRARLVHLDDRDVAAMRRAALAANTAGDVATDEAIHAILGRAAAPAGDLKALRLRAHNDVDLSELSPALWRIMLALCEGRSTKAIAASTTRSPHTIRNQTREVFRIMKVHSRAELVAKCARLGLLPPSEVVS
jgi:DNA-binding NarL/FixJ family response regulator